MARKHWGVGQEEWDRLPWYTQQRALIALSEHNHAENYHAEQARRKG
jgi:hypothetical protein